MHEMTCEVAISGLRLQRNHVTRPVGPSYVVELQSQARYGDLTCHQVHKLNYTTVTCIKDVFSMVK